MSGAEDDLVGHTLIPLDKVQTEVGGSRRSTLTQREPPNPYKNKRKIVAVAAIVILGLTVWSCIAAYYVVKHLVWGPDIVLEESSAGAEIHVPAPSPLPLTSIRWTAQHVGPGQEKGRSQEKGKIKDQGRSHAGKSPTVACIVHARRQRLQQVLATSKTWLPTCDAHALIAFGDVPKELQSFPHVVISQPGTERCADRIALNISTVLFPQADWVFLASDDSFVMVDRLREWLGGLKTGSYPDLPADGKPSLLISRSSIRSLNTSECDAGASPSVASLLKRSQLQPVRPVDTKGLPIVLNKYKTDNQFDLSPQLSIIEKVSAAEMTLLHHIHAQKHD